MNVTLIDKGFLKKYKKDILYLTFISAIYIDKFFSESYPYAFAVVILVPYLLVLFYSILNKNREEFFYLLFVLLFPILAAIVYFADSIASATF